MRLIVAIVIPGAACLAATPLIAASGDMSVAGFLEKADRLEQKGALAVFSSDLKLLQAEAKGAAAAYRARIAADKKSGRDPHSCPPAGKLEMNSKDLLAHLRSYPAAQRGSIPMTGAFADMMAKRYPCK